MSKTFIHILEPTVRSVYGHHYVYCERAAAFFGLRGYDAACYYAWEGKDDPELNARAASAHYAFLFRFGRAFELSHGAQIRDDDPIERRGLRDAKTAVRKLVVDGSIRSENLLWRLCYDLDTVASGYQPTQAEARTAAEAGADISAFADMLAINHHANRNVLFLPTGEYFLLKALIAELDAIAPSVSQIHVRLWNFLSLEKAGGDLVGLALALQTAAAQHGVEVFLYAEAPWACGRLEKFSRLPVGYLDINSFSFNFVEGAVVAAQARAEGPPPRRLRVFFPGAYRRYPDKGLDFVRSLLTLQPFPETLTLVLQQPDYGALRLNEAFVANHPGVVLLPRILADDVYRQQFQLADLLCAPYDDVTWPDQNRGSGVILEAFLAARPVAVSAVTPLARYGDEYLINLLDGPESLVRLAAEFDVGRQERDAAENARRYAAAIGRNDMLRRLPPPGSGSHGRVLADDTDAPAPAEPAAAASALAQGGSAV